MSREIKFRAWVEYEDKSRMVKPEGVSMANGELVAGVWNYEETEIVEECPSVFMQFTGLKDKNGNEIYEGDIVTNGDWVCPVSFSEIYGGWAVEGGDTLANWEPGQMLQVIGNIYETPELLKGH